MNPHNDSATNLPYDRPASRLERIEQDIVEIKYAVLGSPKNGQPSLGMRVAALEKVVETHDRKIWLASTIAAAVGAVLMALRDLFTSK